MVPDLDLQIQVVLKALSDIVKPALDPADKPASEQIGLAITTLGMVRTRLPIQRKMVRRLLEDAILLAEALDDADGDASHALHIAAARAILADPDAEAHEIEACRGELSRKTAEFLSAAGADGIVRFGQIVLEQSRPPVERIRAWFAGSGFEGEAMDFRSIDELLNASRQPVVCAAEL